MSRLKEKKIFYKEKTNFTFMQHYSYDMSTNGVTVADDKIDT